MAWTTAQLPKFIPGSTAELVEIASAVIDGVSGGRRGTNDVRLKRVAMRLYRIASTVLADLRQQAQSPSAKELETRLERISRLSRALAEEMCSLPAFSLGLLNAAYHAQRGWDEAARTSVDLGLGGAPAELAASAIHMATTQQLESWRQGSILGRIPPIRPGRQHAFQRVIGDPRVFLADQVAHLIVQEQGVDVVTADVKGPVYDVVARLWTYATGLPEAGADLRQYVRRGVWSVVFKTEWRDVTDKIEKEQREFYTEPDKYMDPHTRKEFRIRMEMLEAKARELSDRAHAALWDYDLKIGPNSPPA